MTAARHTSREFITFLTGLVERAERAQEIHVGSLSLHADLFVLAESSGTVVRKDPT